MRRLAGIILIILTFTSVFTVLTVTSLATVQPDVYMDTDTLESNLSWTKHGSVKCVGYDTSGIIKYIPDAAISNGFGFKCEIPLEYAKYVVVRYYTNVVANKFQVSYTVDETFNYENQHGSGSIENSAGKRVAVIDMTSAVSAADIAGKDNIEYVKLIPWDGQTWKSELSLIDCYFNLYSLAFFEDSAQAQAYATELEKSLPDISVDKTIDNNTPEISTRPYILYGMVEAFKSQRTDHPFMYPSAEGSFRPDGTLTRAEACSVISRILTVHDAISGKYTTKFIDVKQNAWYYDFVAHLENLGYFDGLSGEFLPHSNITRAEFVELVSKMDKVQSDLDGIFAAEESLDTPITRAEVARVLCIALGRTSTEAGMLDLEPFDDVPKSHPDYIYIMESTHRHKLTLDGNGEEIWEELVENELIIYPEYPERIGRNYDYSVSVTQGDVTRDLTVYSEMRQPNGVNNPYGDNYRRFCEFAYQGEAVRIDITVNMSFSEYTVIPANKQIPSTVNGNVISIYVNEPGQLILRLGNGLESNNTNLAIFVDPPEENVPDKDDPNVIYIEGWYEEEDNHLNVNDNKTVYIAPGAVCNARILTRGSNITITGRGMVRDPNDTRTTNVHGYNYNININQGDNIRVDGIKIVDCLFYHLWTSSAVNGVEIYNVKLMSSQISTDGFIIDGSNIYLHNCYADVGDDAFTGTATNKYYEDVLVGSTCGIFSLSGARTNEVYKDINIFRADEAIFKNYYGSGVFTGARFENVYAVDCPFTPYLFNTVNQGAGLKQINFKNISIQTPTGTMDKTQAFNKYRDNIIAIQNGDDFEFNFENLYIDGNLITDADAVKRIDRSVSGITVNVSTNALEQNKIPKRTNTTVLDTPYFAPRKTTQPLHNGENLIPNPSFEDGANPFITVDFAFLELRNDANFGNYSMYIPATSTAGGITVYLTDTFNRGGAGKYLLEFYAKKEPGSGGAYIDTSFTCFWGEPTQTSDMRREIQSDKHVLTDMWQKYSTVITVEESNFNNVYLSFKRNSTYSPMNFYLDDLSLVKLPVIVGDTSGDGNVNSSDLISALRGLAGWDGYTHCINRANFDFNGDFEVNAVDAIIFTRHIAGWNGYESLEFSQSE